MCNFNNTRLCDVFWMVEFLGLKSKEIKVEENGLKKKSTKVAGQPVKSWYNWKIFIIIKFGVLSCCGYSPKGRRIELNGKLAWNCIEKFD